MTEMQQLIAMLRRTNTDYDVSDGTKVEVEGVALFIFHIDESLAEVWSLREYDGGC